MTDVYIPQTWANGVLGGTPINAERLQHIENGIVRSAPSQGNIYAPIPTGDPDVDVANLQASIDACMPDADTSTTRVATKKLFLAPGNYALNSPLRVESVLDFTMLGAGLATRFIVQNDMECAIDFNGVANCVFGDFSILGVPGATVDRALWVRWGDGIGRSTTNNTFGNIYLRNLEYKRGFQIGEDGAVNQVDTDLWINCQAVGDWVDPEATLYQYGWYVGSGVSANNLLHTFIGCGGNSNKYNLYNAASEVSWTGGILQHAEVDVLVTATGYTKVTGTRSEHSTRFLSTGGPAGFPAHVSVADIDCDTTDLNADNGVITWNLGGHLSVKNFNIPAVTGKAPKIIGSNAGAPYTMDLDSCTSTTAVSAFASVFSGSKLIIRNYNQINSSGASTSVTALLTNGPVLISDDNGANSVSIKNIGNVAVGTVGQFVADSAGVGGGIQLKDDGAAHISRWGGSSRELYFDLWKFVVFPRLTLYDFVDLAQMSSNDLQLNDTAGNTLVHINASKLGFFGATPIVKPAANPDTSGATLAQLETEVNELKATLRALGLLS